MADLKDWKFWMDVGGTFTDCIAAGPGGEIRTRKILSTGVFKGSCSAESTKTAVVDSSKPGYPEEFFAGYRLRLIGPGGRPSAGALVAGFDPAACIFRLAAPLAEAPFPGQAFELRSGEEAPVAGVRLLLGLPLAEPIENADLKIGTTVGTNALLERKGAKTALLTTAGFEDLLLIGTQERPGLFDLDIRKPECLFSAVKGIGERIDCKGRVLKPLDEAEVIAALADLRNLGAESLAVCFLNSYRNPAHEERAAELAAGCGFEYVSASSIASPSINMVARGDTAVVDAYLTPVLRRYFSSLECRFRKPRIRVMTSAGGLVSADKFTGRDSILSGPAGGVTGFAWAAAGEGFAKAVGFDMGGTSTDVSRHDGCFEYQFETEKAGVRISAPMLAVETVAAGGGSICGFDGSMLVVGPRSAGADPGPACYGRGGPLTITDTDLYLGRIAADSFPFRLNPEAVEKRLGELAIAVNTGLARKMSRIEIAEGLRRIADANMAAPIRRISVARGYDVREYALVAFGGAGPQHACAVARLLGIGKILLPPFGGVLSALGIGTADVRRFGQRPVLRPFSAAETARLEPQFLEMEDMLRREVAAEGIPEPGIDPPRRMLDMRYEGEGSALTVEAEGGDFGAAFESMHRRIFGHAYRGRPVEISAMRVEVVGRTAKIPEISETPVPRKPKPSGTSVLVVGLEPETVPLFMRAMLRPGDSIRGPALIAEETSTIVVETGFDAEVTAKRNIVLSDVSKKADGVKVTSEADPVTLEIMSSQFSEIASRMGETLRRTAFSTNIKERLDFSCAIFDSECGLVANAHHIPVHIGAMGETVKRLAAEATGMKPGDAYLTNDPACGGSHLPDLTVVTPVFLGGAAQPAFYSACRAHHAEIGGIRPGSMPPDSRTLAEEGVIFRNFLLMRDGRLMKDELLSALSSGPFPSRKPLENLADVEAQIAANVLGESDLRAMIERYGPDAVSSHMRHIQKAAEQRMRLCLLRLGDGVFFWKDRMDDGAEIAVKIAIAKGEAVLDFSGTSGVHPGNFNAGSGVVTAAVLYCLRLLIAEDVPLNRGVLAPVKIRIPHGMLNPPETADRSSAPAVAAGNVETSQRLVDVILGALGAAAASQGTMNNVAFGNDRFSYYETICGGAGAGNGFHGASAVHTHMTNTRITDPEILEARCPVLLPRFAIRRGSGGMGKWKGGDGAVREIEFLEACEVSIISSRRKTAPYGINGGEPGMPGRNMLFKAHDPAPIELDPVCTFNATPGDRLVIETPGGGAFKPPVCKAPNPASG